MDQGNQGINPDALSLVPLKRKRGRPRKHPKTDLNHGGRLNHGGSVVAARSLNFYRAYSARIPPGFERMNSTKPRQEEDAFSPSRGNVVGQPVYGVIEAAFDAGYLLTVKVGNSETTLRGVVLKPGHYVPVSAKNDVAPNVQMIQRNEARFPNERKVRIRSFPNVSAHPCRESTVTTQVPLSAPCVSNAGIPGIKPAPVITNHPATSLTSRGNVVPVFLQPANIPAGGPVINQVSAATCQSGPAINQVSAATSQSADSVLNPKAKQENAPVISNLQLPVQTPNSQPVPKVCSTNVGLCNQASSQMSNMIEANSAGTECKPFEKLLTQMMKGAALPSQKVDAFSGGLTVNALGNETDDAPPISPEPLRAVDPANSMFKSFENFGTGKMTELLKAVQENMRDNPVAQAKKLPTRRGPNVLDKETIEFMECP